MVRALTLMLLMGVFFLLAFHPAREIHGPESARKITILNLVMALATFGVLIYHLSRGITAV